MHHHILACLLLSPLAVLATAATPDPATKPDGVASPDGRLVVDFHLTDAGAPRYAIRLAGRPVLAESQLGLVRDDADFSWGLALIGASEMAPVRDQYEILTVKRRLNTYRANRREFHLQTPAGRRLDVIFQVSDDGVAFRYRFPETDATVHRLRAEESSFHFLPGTRAWLQPIAVAKQGWSLASPSYEEYYQKDIPVGTPSPTGAGWVYPALFRTGLRRDEVSGRAHRPG